MRTGIMGGTFDPIHNAHVKIAVAARRQMHLDRVLFIPVGDPPHKQMLSGAQDRLRMVELAVAGLDWAYALDIEATRTGTTYTVDTLTQLIQRWPQDTFYYIVGADALRDMPKWREARRVMRMCSLIAFPRPGMDESQVKNAEQEAIKQTGAKVEMLSIEPIPISSTDIRKRRRRGEPIAGLVPKVVEDYIIERGLYL